MAKSPVKAKRRAAFPVGQARKRSVTIRDDLDAAAHELVGDRGFSALVNDALEREIQHRRMGDYIAEFEAKYGVITEAEMDRAMAKSRLWKKRR